jgi:hypothetical protein
MTLPDTLAVASLYVLGGSLTILFWGTALGRLGEAIVDWGFEDYGEAVFHIGVALAAIAGWLGTVSVLSAMIRHLGA